jgi:predicted O-methyltransferase YrrM
MGLSRTIRRWRVRLGRDGARALALHRDLQGQLAMEECRFLLRAAAGRGTIVEIGSYRGKSCALLALGSAPGGRVTAIDPHLASEGAGTTGYGDADEREFHATMARLGVADRVEHWVERSDDARPRWPDAPIDLLWIDGDHSYEAVARDLDDWSPLVRTGGVLACHDYGHREGVRRAWDERIAPDAGWGPTRRVRSIAWTERRSGGPA